MNASNIKLAGFLLMALFFVSCQKGKLKSGTFMTQKVKVFEDSLAGFKDSYPYMRMVAGKDRLYMIYSAKDSVDNFKGYLKLIITDNAGNLIKRKIINNQPANALGLVVTSDNTCIIVQKKNTFSDWATSDTLLITKLDRDGNLLAEETIDPPPNLSTIRYATIKLFQTPSGNLLIYGSHNDGLTKYMAYALEYNQNNQITWSRKYFFPNNPVIDISDCLSDMDGGYLFLCNRSETTAPGGRDAYLFKTNSTGDSLWTKTLVTKTIEDVSLLNFFRLNNGNYQVSMNRDVNLITGSYVCKFNSNGDSLAAINISKFNPSNITAMLKMANGKTFCLISNFDERGGATLIPYTVQINSRYLILDDNLNIITDAYFQNSSKDYIRLACITSDQHIACFGLMQGANENYFKPELIILNPN